MTKKETAEKTLKLLSGLRKKGYGWIVDAVTEGAGDSEYIRRAERRRECSEIADSIFRTYKTPN